jgi:PAS domain S-box-containing protein
MKEGKSAPATTPAHKSESMPSPVSFSEAYYQTLVELSPQIVWMTNADGTATTYCNRYWYEYSGLTAEQTAGNGWRLILHPDDQEQAIRLWQEAVALGRAYAIEYRLRRASDGEYRWHLGKGLPVTDAGGTIMNWMGIAVDIHDNKLLEEALQNSQARLNTILETEPECVTLHSPDHNLEYMNPAGRALIQADSLEQMKGRRLRDFVAPQYRSDFEELTRNVFLGQSGKLEFEATGLKGRRYWLETHAVPLSNGHGSISHVLAVTRDITGKRAAQQALQASEARFRALIENSSDGIVLLSQEADIGYASPTVTRILGYTPSELVGRQAMEFIHPGDSMVTKVALRQIADEPGKAVSLTARVRHRDGTWRFLEGTFTNLLDDANVRAIVGNYRDITDRVRAEEALQRSEKRFEATFRSSPLAIGISTLAEGRCLDVNDTFLQMVEYKREEVVGRTAQEIGIWRKTGDRDIMVRQLAETGHVSGLQTTFRTRSGKIREIEFSAALVELDNVACVLSISRDVTEAKVLEQQLQQARKMEAVGRLAGGVAHDFNNLLMIISGCAQLIKEEAGKNQTVVKLAEQVLTAVRSAASVTKQLLVFSRKQPQAPKVFNLNEVVAQFCKMLPRFIAEDIEMIVAPTAEIGLVYADPGQIEQVVMNLVVNARDSMPGGGRLTVETNNVEITAEDSLQHGTKVPPGKYVMIIISDTGIGMDVETQKRIFEPFFTTKEIGRGTGLGLATVYGIVKQSRGFLSVYSEIGRGTTFKVYFPKAAGDKQGAEGRPAIEIAGGRGSETILVVEDQEALRKIIAEYLSSQGYRVLEAENGDTALQVCRTSSEPIHIVLSDVVMPGMAGPDFVRAALEVHPEAQVIFMSGYSDRSVDAAGLKVKPAILHKPMELHSVLRTIRSLLDQKQDQATISHQALPSP